MSPHRPLSVVIAIASALVMTSSLHGESDEELYPGLRQTSLIRPAPSTAPAAPSTSPDTAPAAPPASRVIPPLTPAQLEQLATAVDDERVFDTAALYPLLQNATEWPVGVESGAMIPDFHALRDNPDDYRGKLLLIEGEFITESPAGRLARPGPWEPKVRRWVVRPDSKQNELLVIYLVNPPPMPRSRQSVRLIARFYMLWTDDDRRGAERSYPILVGSGARIVADRTRVSTFTSSPLVSVGMVAVGGIVVMIIVRMVMRSMFSRRTAMDERREARELRDEEEREALRQVEKEGPPLPDDPIEAMEELKRRREQTQNETLKQMGIDPSEFNGTRS